MQLSRTFIKWIIFFVFVAVIGTPLFYFAQGVYPYTLPKMVLFQACAELIFFLWLGLCILDKKYRPKWSPYLLGLAVFIGVLMITAFFGADSWRSFWSTQERSFGVVTMIHFALFALVISSMRKEIPWRALLYSSFATTVFVDFLAFIQLKVPNLLLDEEVGNRVGATFGNPTFFAAYLVPQIILGIYFLICALRAENKNLASRILLTASVAVNILTLVFSTQTRGDILGLAVGIGILFILFAWRPPSFGGFLGRRMGYAILLLLALGASTTFWFTRSASFWSHIPGLGRFQSISLVAGDLQPRLMALRAAWEGFKERPIFGWGWDNFNIVFNKHYDPRALESGYQETRFDKPHNVVLEYMVTGGIFGIMAYIGLFCLLIYEGFRLKDKLLGQITLAFIVAYFVRNLFVFETIGGILPLYLLMGWIDGQYREERTGVPATQNPSVQMKHAGWAKAVALLGILPVYFLNFQTLYASNLQFRGFKNFLNRHPDQALDNFKAAVAIPNPYQWNLRRDYATAVAEAYFYNPNLFSPAEAEEAVQTMERATAEHPDDAYNHYSLIDLYNQISSINPEKYLPAAEHEAQIALQLSPDRQEIYFSLTKTKTLEKDMDGALITAKYAVDLDPKVADAHFYYGLVAFADNKPDLGYSEIHQALDLGRKWQNENEPRVAANFFADSGHLDEAIGFYEDSLKLWPDSVETKIKLGIAYFYAGKKDLARQYISEVMTRADLTKSPSYSQLLPILRELGLSN